MVSDTAVLERNKLVEENLLFVRNIARSVARNMPPNVDPDDMASDGAMGLIYAAENFDPGKATLRTHAYTRTRGAMIDGLRKLDHVPRNTRTLAGKIDNAVTVFHSECDRNPTDDELASALHTPHTEVVAARTTPQIFSLDEITHYDGRRSMGFEDTRTEDPSAVAERRDMYNTLLGILEPIEKTVVKLRCQGYLMREIGSMIHFSESRASQICSLAITKMRTYLHTHSEEFTRV